MSAGTMSRFRLDGRVALVTGAARGIGAAVAEAMAEAGAAVVVTDRLEDQGQATVRRIKDQGGKALFVTLDVTVEDQWEAAVAAAQQHFGGLDVLVNNAGIVRDRMFANTSEEEFDAVTAVHLKGHFATMKHAAAYWRAKSKAGETVEGTLRFERAGTVPVTFSVAPIGAMKPGAPAAAATAPGHHEH